MLTKAVEQFLRDVAWGEMDYLLIDMPPGTGDVQMGLARMLPRTDLIIVTTPAQAAQALGVSEADVMQSLESGDLKGKKIGSSYRITRAALNEFLQS